MELTSQREVRQVDPSWSLAELMSHLTKSLENTGPALALSHITTQLVPSEIAVIVSTSGSTGAAKEVGLTSAAIQASAQASNEFIGATTGSVWSLLLPLTHIAGINVLVRSLKSQTTPIDLTHNVGKYPDVDFTSIVPTQLFRALSSEPDLLSLLQNCNAVLVGGAALSDELRDQAKSQGLRIIETYGMTETNGGCIYDGKPLNGVEVKLNSDGLIQISGATIATTYLNQVEQWNSNFDGTWFTTSDLGRMDNGTLKVLGRTDDVIVSGGENISLPLIESTLKRGFAKLECAAFSKNDLEWGQALFLAVVGTPIDNENEIRNYLENELGEYAKPKGFIYIDSIPKTSLGKVDRPKLKELARDE